MAVNPLRHFFVNPRLARLVDSLLRLGERGAPRDALARVLRAVPIGLGAGMGSRERQCYFQQALTHDLDWAAPDIEKWRRICGVRPRDFFRTRPQRCTSWEWSRPACLCVSWRTAARRLLWVGGGGGGLALETFEDGEDPRHLMFDLYPSASPIPMRAAFDRATAHQPLLAEALALWALVPGDVGALAQRRLARVPRAEWSPCVREILVSATRDMLHPRPLGALLRALPLPDRFRVAHDKHFDSEWADFLGGTLRSLKATGLERWRVEDARIIVQAVLAIAATASTRLTPTHQRAVETARRLLPHLGPGSGHLILQYLDSRGQAGLPHGMVVELLLHPEAEIRDAALRFVAKTGANGGTP